MSLSTWRFTVGAGVKRPIGEVREFSRETLHEFLLEEHSDEAWFSGQKWTGNHRMSKNFESADALLIDLDHGEYSQPDALTGEMKRSKAPMAVEHRQRALDCIRAGLTAADFGYSTPHGIRLVLLLPQTVTSPVDYAWLAKCAAAYSQKKLMAAGVTPQLEIDSCCEDVARLMFVPNISSGSKARQSEVVVSVTAFDDEKHRRLRARARELQAGQENKEAEAELARRGRAEESKAKYQKRVAEAKQRNEASPVSFLEALARYESENQGRAEGWPRKTERGECPMCGSPDGFSKLSDTHGRALWACRSTTHQVANGGRIGKRGAFGGVADFDAALLGVSVGKMLSDGGFFEAPHNG